MGTHGCEQESCIPFAGVTLQPSGVGRCERVDAAIAEFERGARHAKRAYKLQRDAAWLDKKRWPSGREAFLSEVLTDAYAHEEEATAALLATVPATFGGMLDWLAFIRTHAGDLYLSEPGWLKASQLQAVLQTVEAFVCAQEEARNG